MANINNRVYYACQAVAIAPSGSTERNVAIPPNFVARGVQSIGITTNFNLEQAFELGQLEIYENIEGTPDVEVTMEKVLDGHPLLYHLATCQVIDNPASGLAARSAQRCDVRLGIFDEQQNFVGSQNAPVEVAMTGMYVSSISYNLGTEGSFTESITLVGNNKQWLKNENGLLDTTSVANLDGNDSPIFGMDGSPPKASGGIQRREDFILEGCILPETIDGIVSSAYGNGLNNGVNRVHLQSISIATDFSRDDVLELGRKTPYYRPANFPIEVTCDIEAITISGDFIEASEIGLPSLHPTARSGDNLGEDTIFIITRNGYAWDLGSKNKISSVSYGGGDAGGGNATVTYSYTNFNELDVQAINQVNATGDFVRAYVGSEALKLADAGTETTVVAGKFDWPWE